jgi:hypothetical protein
VEKKDPVTHGFFCVAANPQTLKNFAIQIHYSESIVPELRVDPCKQSSSNSALKFETG